MVMHLVSSVMNQAERLPVPARPPQIPHHLPPDIDITVALDRRVFHEIDRRAKDVTEGRRPYVHMAVVSLPDLRVRGLFKVHDGVKIAPIRGIVVAKLDYV